MNKIISSTKNYASNEFAPLILETKFHELCAIRSKDIFFVSFLRTLYILRIVLFRVEFDIESLELLENYCLDVTEYHPEHLDNLKFFS